MLGMILVRSTTPVISWFADILGMLMSLIYNMFDKFGIENIGICIIVFTVIVKLVLFPLQVKQQKFTKLNSVMTPELQAIQKKYQNKRDQDSVVAMNEETKAVYEKYGTSPTGSCLQMLIQLPILFSLYYIIASIPAYVPAVHNYFEPVSNYVVDSNLDENNYKKADYDDFTDYDKFYILNTAYDKYVKGKDYKYVDRMLKTIDGQDDSEKVNDIIAKYSDEQWSDLSKCYENSASFVKDINNAEITESQWKKIIKDDDAREKFLTDIEEGEFKLECNKENVDKAKSNINKVYTFGPINLGESPSSAMGLALLIPLISCLAQFFSVFISMRNQDDSAMQNNQMANSMKVTMYVMPLMSGFIALSVPAGLGLYWALTGIIQAVTQLILINYFKNVDVQDIIDKNMEKVKKKKAKKNIDSDKVTSAATTSTKSLKSKANINTKNVVDSNKKYKSGSMAEKANLVKSINEANNKNKK